MPKIKYKFNAANEKKLFEEKIEGTEIVISIHKIGNGSPKM